MTKTVIQQNWGAVRALIADLKSACYNLLDRSEFVERTINDKGKTYDYG